MQPNEQAFSYIEAMINSANTYFAFRCIDLAIDEFKTCYTQDRVMRGELIDARHDRFFDVFKKPNIQIKPQTNG